MAVRAVPDEEIVPSTRVKNEFGRILQDVSQGSHVVVTRNGHARAVIVPAAEYEAWKSARVEAVARVSAEVDAWFQSLQAPGVAEALERAFQATGEELADAAVEGARAKG